MPQFGSQIDTLRIPVKGLIPEQNGTGFPSSPVEGLMCHRTDLKQVFIYLNATWVQMDNVAGGTASNVTDGDKGAITVTGGVWALDAGTVGSSQIIDGSIVDADINSSAAIAQSKISGLVAALAAKVAKAGDTMTGDLLLDAAAGTVTPKVSFSGVAGVAGSVYGDATAQAMRYNVQSPYGNFHEFDLNGTAVLTLGGTTHSSTKPIALPADPASPLHAATKQYVDLAAQGLDAKQSVRLATTISIALTGAQSIDGVAVVTGDRILVKNQLTDSQNGIYIANTAGAWTRATDMDAAAEFPGAFVFVEEGTANADNGYVCVTNAPVTLGTTSITWTQFSGAGQVIAGAGLTKSGNTIDVGTLSTSGITVNADDIAIKLKGSGGLSVDASGVFVDLTAVVPSTRTISTTAPLTGGGDLSANRTLGISNFTSGAAGAVPASGGGTANFLRADGTWAAPTGNVTKYAGDVNAGSAIAAGTEYTITHNLNSLDVQVGFIRKTSPAAGAGAGPGISLTWRAINANSIGVTADVAFAANEIRCVVTA